MKIVKNKFFISALIFVVLAVIGIIIISWTNNKPIDINPNQKLKSNILFNSFGGWVKITKKYCGPYGFSTARVKETTTHCIIRYEYPGYAKMLKLNKHNSTKIFYPYDNMVKAIHYAYKQISLGKLEGQQIMPHTFIRIKWRASSSDTLTADSEVLAW
ncbi:MAG: hypothetical protein WCR42_15630 [bacterium]